MNTLRHFCSTKALGLALALAGAVSLRGSAVAGQNAPRPGSRVRIQTIGADSSVVGRLVSLNDEGLWYASTDDQEVHVEPTAIERVELAHTGTRTGAGLAIGAFSGALVLGIVAMVTYEEPRCTSFCVQIFDEGDTFFLGAAGGALAGGLVGAMIGSMIKTESWTPLVRPLPDPRRGAVLGVGVRLTL